VAYYSGVYPPPPAPLLPSPPTPPLTFGISSKEAVLPTYAIALLITGFAVTGGDQPLYHSVKSSGAFLEPSFPRPSARHSRDPTCA
jgi:hypothetical protein